MSRVEKINPEASEAARKPETVKIKKVQFGAVEGRDCDYEVKKPFLLQVRHGPPEPVEEGEIVTLKRDTAIELLYSDKIMPLDMPEEDSYEVIIPFTYVTEGEYRKATTGEVLVVGREAALRLMIKGYIRPVDSEAFYPYRKEV